MSFFGSLKEIYWADFASKDARFQYINAFLASVPGLLGSKLRARIIPKYFRHAGCNTFIARRVGFCGAKYLSVGDNVGFAEDDLIQAQGGLTIGDNTIFGPSVKIWTVNHKFDAIDVPIIEQGFEKKPVMIGKNVWIGANAFVMPGVEIPDGCIVSAGAVVGIKQYKPFSIIAGNPARVIGTRNPKDKGEQKQ